jgi:hypothetical protein
MSHWSLLLPFSDCICSRSVEQQENTNNTNIILAQTVNVSTFSFFNFNRQEFGQHFLTAVFYILSVLK